MRLVRPCPLGVTSPTMTDRSRGLDTVRTMTETAAGPVLSTRFVEALAFAIRAHGDQRRKGGDIPYIAHLLGAASLVLEAGGVEELAIAGLLHDTLEDTETTAREIEVAFGQRVAASSKLVRTPMKSRSPSGGSARNDISRISALPRPGSTFSSSLEPTSSTTPEPTSWTIDRLEDSCGAASKRAPSSSFGITARWSTSSGIGFRDR